MSGESERATRSFPLFLPRGRARACPSSAWKGAAPPRRPENHPLAPVLRLFSSSVHSLLRRRPPRLPPSPSTRPAPPPPLFSPLFFYRSSSSSSSRTTDPPFSPRQNTPPPPVPLPASFPPPPPPARPPFISSRRHLLISLTRPSPLGFGICLLPLIMLSSLLFRPSFTLRPHAPPAICALQERVKRQAHTQWQAGKRTRPLLQ